MEKNNIIIEAENDIERKRFQFIVKRLLDVILSIIGIIILSPLFLIIIIVIKIDSKGPAMFMQTRIGKNEKPFTIYKFRTMIVDAEKSHKLELDSQNIDNFIFQNKNDNRITKVGAFLRKSSFDEIPQLFNVLIGNMSFVGPRPEIPEVVKHYPEYYKQRLLVLPGITGLAQVSGRGEIELRKTIFYDLTYIKKFSIIFDIKLLFLTFISVFKKEGAY